MSRVKTLLDKVWAAHAIAEVAGYTLVYVDRNLLHEGSKPAFATLKREKRQLRRPNQTFAIADHYAPTDPARGFVSPAIEADVRALAENSEATGITHYGVGDPRQGIVHVVTPEQGIVQPGMTVVCGDSHTSTCGALGTLGLGIGASELEHVLATQTLWLKKPKSMLVHVGGTLPSFATAKDLVLHIIAKVGVAGGIGHVIEFGGPAIEALSMEQRFTICNMAVEAGGRTGIIAPDDKTFAYLEGRHYSPRGADWDKLVAAARMLRSDADAVYDRRVDLDATGLAPMVTWGTTPEQAAPIGDRIPQLSSIEDPARRAVMQRALEYMALEPGQELTSIAIDRIFIGSCTNGRIEDLRSAAQVLRGRRVRVPGIVVPGSHAVKKQAEAEGLHAVFVESGLEWREPGCSMCIAINGDITPPGERCASTSNRNFENRQGKGARTHLMSPAMAAAAAIAGRLADVRELV